MSRILGSLLCAMAIMVFVIAQCGISKVLGEEWSMLFTLFVLTTVFYFCSEEPKKAQEEQKEELPDNGTWRMDRFGSMYDSYFILYTSTNPNGTINIHFADGKVINTMITDIVEFNEKIIGETPRIV